MLKPGRTDVKKCLFVDYENVSTAGSVALDAADLEVWVFVGPNQKSVTLRSLLQFGNKTGIIQIAKAGKNSLDFHICYELGALSREQPKPDKVYVLSKDKGYDAIIEYGRTRGLMVERITDLSGLASPKLSPEATSTPDLIIASLRRMQSNLRPRKEANLRAHLVNQFKKVQPETVNAAIDQLFASGRLGHDNGKVKYNL